MEINGKTTNLELLWTSPEILRSGDLRATREGDMYSFGIVVSEFINNDVAWSESTREEKDVDGWGFNSMKQNYNFTVQDNTFLPKRTFRNSVQFYCLGVLLHVTQTQ